jgi:nucleoside-diphosphate-sugar epimerase
MTQILVTGASGYLGTQLLAQLLRAGQDQPVRAQVRSAARAAELRASVRRGGADDAGLEVVTADLMSDDGWKAAMAGVDEVYHVASPIPAAQPDNPDELIIPAREGAVRVLRAARDAGARRVVFTSSFVAIGYTPKPSGEFTEDDWTDPDTPGLAPYPRSKAIAERAAWDFMNGEGGGTELVVANPTFILGPPLTAATGSSMHMVKAFFSGQLSVVPRHRFGIVDVRDAADLHVRAMAAPAAAGKRYIGVSDRPPLTYLDLALFLRERFGDLAAKVPTEQEPGDEPPRTIIRNDRAKAELGWQPRPVEDTIADTVQDLLSRGELPG